MKRNIKPSLSKNISVLFGQSLRPFERRGRGKKNTIGQSRSVPQSPSLLSCYLIWSSNYVIIIFFPPLFKSTRTRLRVFMGVTYLRWVPTLAPTYLRLRWWCRKCYLTSIQGNSLKEFLSLNIVEDVRKELKTWNVEEKISSLTLIPERTTNGTLIKMMRHYFFYLKFNVTKTYL